MKAKALQRVSRLDRPFRVLATIASARLQKVSRLDRPFRVLATMPGVRQDFAGALVRGKLPRAFRMVCTVARHADVRALKIVSRRYRYVWLSNPKVATQSIKSALCSVTPDAEVFRGMSIGEVFAVRPDARRYYSFAFVRHPYTRALSSYVYWNERLVDRKSQVRKKQKRYLFKERYGWSEITSFDEYCGWLATPYGSDAFAEGHYLSQHLQVRLEDGRLPTFVGRFENLDQDFERVVRYLGLPQPKLPMLNTMVGWRPRPVALPALQAAHAAMNEHLTEDNKALLRVRYAKDFQVGGYTP